MKNTSQLGWAVITGAAGGLGSSFARQLAQRGHHLLLVDRRQEPLERLCEALSAQFQVGAEPYVADLCHRDEVEQLADRLEHMGDVELLVNNAGFGTVDYFFDTDPSYLVGMVDLHVMTPTLLTRALLPGMVERNRGNIINVSSLGAFFHSAGNVQYGSTKNYLAVFSQALQQELVGTNVRVQALCPGFVRTEFHGAESMKAFKLRASPAERLWMTPDQVVACSLSNLNSRQVLVVPGLGYRIAARFAQMPFLQPLMQWISRGPRSVPASTVVVSVPPTETTSDQPVLSMAKRA